MFQKQKKFQTIGMFLLPIAIFATMGWMRRWMSDDGLINIRVVHNLLAGHGPVFNVGERVEAYTSAIWVAWISLFGMFGLTPEVVSVYSGLVFANLGVFLGMLSCYRFVISHHEQQRESFIPVGMLVFVVLPPFWDFSTSGLENGFALFWIGLAMLMLERFTRNIAQELTERKSYLLLGVVLSFGPLIRPELSLFSLYFGAAIALLMLFHLSGWRALRSVLLFSLCLGAIPVSYQIFRMGYFAAIVPNTAFAKEAFFSRWNQGGAFFANFFFLYHALIPLLLLFFIAYPRAKAALYRRLSIRHLCYVSPMFIGLFYTVYVVKVGGGFMHGRMFMTPFFCLLYPFFVLPVSYNRLWKNKQIYVAISGIAIWCLVVGLFIRVKRANEFGIGDERGWYSRQAKKKNPIRHRDFRRSYLYQDAKQLRDRSLRLCKRRIPRSIGPKNCKRKVFVESRYGYIRGSMGAQELATNRVHPSIAFVAMRSGMGIRSLVFGKNYHVVDNLGLGSPLASRLVVKKRGRPGHEKSMKNLWLVARYVKPHNREIRRVKLARQALYCPTSPFGSMIQGITAPLTTKLFMKNLLHSFQYSRIRLPLSVDEAVYLFCKQK